MTGPSDPQCHLVFIEKLRRRAAEMFVLFNAGQFDSMLNLYSEDIRFSFPARGTGTDLHTGCGREQLREALAQLRDSYAPLSVADVFGVNAMRSLIIDDRFGGRIMFSVEVNKDGLADVIFGVRVASPSRSELAVAV